MLQYVLKGATNTILPRAVQQRRGPVNINMIKELWEGLDRQKKLDRAVFAIATMAFYGQMRLGEICTNKEAYTVLNMATTPCLKHLKPPHTQAGSRMLYLPWTKVKQTKGEEVAICRQAGRTDPIRALEKHLEANEIEAEDTALASYITDQGDRKLLTVARFMKRCNEVWQAKGHKKYSGHCFRIRGTTHYLVQGVNPDVVQMMGHWSSDAFMRYWRQLDMVATLHTELMQQSVTS